MILTSIILAIAVSIDSLSVGAIYGIRGIKIPFISRTIIALATFVSFTTSMIFGVSFQTYLSPKSAQLLGAIILLIMGIWLLLKTIANSDIKKDVTKTIATFNIKSLGLVIKILREPISADTDTSGIIDPKEATLLGVALALDAFGAGIGAAMAGFNILTTTFLVTLSSFIFLSLGLSVGYKKQLVLKDKKIEFLPAILLISLAVIKFFY